MKTITIIAISFILLLSSCKKFLDRKPDKRTVVPSTIADLQALLDNNTRMNVNNPSLGEISADNYYLDNVTFAGMIGQDQNAYKWEEDIYTSYPDDWEKEYEPVYHSNIVLETIDKIPRTSLNQNAWDNVKGSALLFRAKAFLQAAYTWAKAFDPATAGQDLGIPLRKTSDFNEISVRASVAETYAFIIAGLKQAADLLPVNPQHVMRPSRPAAYALLARAYLSMREYDSCFRYADLYLQLKNQLVDFNSLNASAAYPLSRFNTEVIMHTSMPHRYVNLADTRGRVDSMLILSYAPNDLRKTIFFKNNGNGSFAFKGSYDNSFELFNGVATDEVWLMRAECFARSGNINSAMNDLDTLLKRRWKTGMFVPFTASTTSQALNLVLTERRKELIFRNLRWMDIKRLNKENAGIVLKRIINNQTFTLLPNDNRYALPIPPYIISFTGMPQNPR